MQKTKEKDERYHGGRWYAEVSAKFIFHGNPVDIILFLEIEKENGGSKWVLLNVYYEFFLSHQLIDRDAHRIRKWCYNENYTVDCRVTLLYGMPCTQY